MRLSASRTPLTFPDFLLDSAASPAIYNCSYAADLREREHFLFAARGLARPFQREEEKGPKKRASPLPSSASTTISAAAKEGCTPTACFSSCHSPCRTPQQAGAKRRARRAEVEPTPSTTHPARFSRSASCSLRDLTAPGRLRVHPRGPPDQPVHQERRRPPPRPPSTFRRRTPRRSTRLPPFLFAFGRR